MPEPPAPKPPVPGRGWESLIWPPWLPLRARLPLIAQITGAAALMAAVAMPTFSEIPPAQSRPAAPRPVSITAPTQSRPAHLNLDVRHAFGSVDLSVTVDGARVLQTKLAGGAKRFGVFGKRGERGFTKTLDLAPGVRIVRVHMRAAADNFDQTRVERFDLEPAAVAAMRIAADKNGLWVVAERPPAPIMPASAVPAPRAAEPDVTRTALSMAPSAAFELYQSLRSILIAIAGFVASAATGFLVEAFLRSRRTLIFAEQAAPAVVPERRRRRRAAKLPRTPDIHASAR